MCSLIAFPSFRSETVQFNKLANELKRCELRCNINQFSSLSLEKIKTDKNILKSIVRDVAVLEIAKMAIEKWWLQTELNKMNIEKGKATQESQNWLIQRYQDAIHAKQQHLYGFYLNVDKL